jgi:hypothetical protein
MELRASHENAKCAGVGSLAKRVATALKEIESTTNTSSSSKHFGKLENSENSFCINRLGR